MLPNNEVRVPQPRLASEDLVSQDITERFTEAASKLKAGELVKDELFTLFEAVGALEIMDAKMDSGYLGPDENHAQALEYDYDVVRELRPEEVLGIMDQLLCHEMAWHMGHSLLQTLFTSVYLDKLLWPVPRSREELHFHRGDSQTRIDLERRSPMTHIILRAYCLALVKACDLVHHRVTAEYYYEEEDFVPNLYNRSLLTEFDVVYIQGIVHHAVSYLEEQTNTVDGDLKAALVDRLHLRNHILTALDGDFDAVDTRDKESFVASLALIPLIEKTMSLGKPIEDAFTVKIQRKLATTIPPRPMVTINASDALNHLKRICQDAIDMQELLEYSCSYDLRVAIWTLASRKPDMSVYIRCLLQTYIVNNWKVLGTTSVKQLLYDELAELVLPSSVLLQSENDEIEMPSDPRFQIAKSMKGFLTRLAQPFVDTLRSACLNRCRIRRALTHTVIDWDNIQVEAEELDAHLQSLTLESPLTLHGGPPTFSYPLSSWVYHEKLGQIRTIFQMGFELSVYAPEELAGMYWYLAHICSTHLAHIDRIQTFVLAEQKRNQRAHRSPSFEKSLAVLDRHRTYLLATDSFALALHALYVFLDRQKVLPHAASDGAYSKARLRYELRMKPLIPISLPELVSFDVYEGEATLRGETDAAVLDRATAAVGEARRAWEVVLAHGAFLPSFDGRQPIPKPAIEADWQLKTKDSLRACIGASIAIETVRKIYTTQNSSATTPTKLRVEIPDIHSTARWHDWWAVPRISEVSSGHR